MILLTFFSVFAISLINQPAVKNLKSSTKDIGMIWDKYSSIIENTLLILIKNKIGDTDYFCVISDFALGLDLQIHQWLILLIYELEMILFNLTSHHQYQVPSFVAPILLQKHNQMPFLHSSIVHPQCTYLFIFYRPQKEKN